MSLRIEAVSALSSQFENRVFVGLCHYFIFFQKL